MGAPYKMKYTNGRKADTTAFPFKAEASPAKFMGAGDMGGGQGRGRSKGGILGKLKDIGMFGFGKGRNKRARVERNNEMIQRQGNNSASSGQGGGGANEAVNARVEEKIEEKADEIVNQQGGQGLTSI